MWNMTLPWWEFVLRGVVVFGAVFLLLRLVGKRSVGEWAPFDLVLLLLVSEAVSNALRADDNSLPGAALVVGTIVLLNWAMGKLGAHSKRVDRAVEGEPRFLVRNGTVDYDALRENSISHDDLMAALRAAECFTPHEAEYAVLETNGSISARRKQREQAF